ncbi:hypothetical protein B5P43_10410 [Bacillus sp. SRB_336]|nr:hypothetical protein B5P43_10410 [Bacillus sp. SRB_336]
MDDKLFALYWQEWESKLNVVAKRGGAQLHFPLLTGPSEGADGLVTYKPDSPLVLHNVLQKGSSGKPGRNSIFIEGSFTFRADVDAWVMTSAGANISIFEVKHEDGKLIASLFDALHFDFEKADAQKPYHPLFHVQRGGNSHLTDNIVIEHLKRQPGMSTATVEVAQGKILGSHHLRIPSPQLDYFSVLIMVIADFFCNPEEKDKNKNMAVLFRDLLKHLCDERNIARQGYASQVLFGRSRNRGWASSADWYAESVA